MCSLRNSLTSNVKNIIKINKINKISSSRRHYTLHMLTWTSPSADGELCTTNNLMNNSARRTRMRKNNDSGTGPPAPR
jgi:hypothetical protein